MAFCPDSKHVLFANKFGDVNVAPVDESGARWGCESNPQETRLFPVRVSMTTHTRAKMQTALRSNEPETRAHPPLPQAPRRRGSRSCCSATGAP